VQRGYKTWAENEASQARSRAGLAAYARLPARLLLEHLNAIVTTPGLIPGMTAADIGQLTLQDPWSWSAVSGSYDGITFVIVNDAHSLARQESNLHHEAAHLIRGHRPSRILKIDGLTLREYDKDAESEAEWFAGCLHLPRAALLTAVRQGEDDSAIGQKFLASAEMVRYRRSVTGVDRQLAFRGQRRPAKQPTTGANRS
jgi:Zn-dependent peptidase ImmA (M78 family)